MSVKEDTVLALKGHGQWQGSDASRGHVSLWVSGRPSSSWADQLEEVPKMARSLGWSKVAFGSDPDHLLPGVPAQVSNLRSALERVGFKETGACFDLVRDLSDYSIPSECLTVLSDSGAAVRPCDVSDIPGLDDFFQREFPGRWRHDVMRKITVDREPGQVFLLTVEDQIEGFAMTQQEGCVRPVAGAVWREGLGRDWGALGPIGVSRSVRGRGLGNALLASSLSHLQKRGARRTVIDWTTLGDFYGAHGFIVTKRYIHMTLDL